MSKKDYVETQDALSAAINEKMSEVMKTKEEMADRLKATMTGSSSAKSFTDKSYVMETMAELNGMLKAMAWLLDEIGEKKEKKGGAND